MDDPTNQLALSTLKTHELVQRYGKAKANTVEVCEHIAELLDRDQFTYGMVNPEVEKVYERMKSCASWLTFRDYIEHDKTRLRSAKFCNKPLLCQACAIRRGAVCLQAYLPRIEVCMKDNPRLKAWLITFTVKNGASLRERQEHLKSSMDRLLNNRKCYLKGTRGFSETEMAKVKGAVFAFEVPKAKNGIDWHPHIHMLALCEDDPLAGFVDPATGEGHGLRKEWFDITGDSFQVDIRRDPNQPVFDMACEVMKYAVKFSSQDADDTWHAFQVLNHKRLLRSFGCLYGVKIPSSMLDSPLSGPYIDRIFSYIGGEFIKTAEIDCSELYEDAS